MHDEEITRTFLRNKSVPAFRSHFLLKLYNEQGRTFTIRAYQKLDYKQSLLFGKVRRANY